MNPQARYLRTEKGHAELFGGRRTLRPRERHVLLLIGVATHWDEIKDRVPTDEPVEDILDRLIADGYVQPIERRQGARTQTPAPTQSVAMERARRHLLDTLHRHAGERSPLCARVQNANSEVELMDALNAVRRLLAAIASAAQAATLETQVLALLRDPT